MSFSTVMFAQNWYSYSFTQLERVDIAWQSNLIFQLNVYKNSFDSYLVLLLVVRILLVVLLLLILILLGVLLLVLILLLVVLLLLVLAGLGLSGTSLDISVMDAAK